MNILTDLATAEQLFWRWEVLDQEAMTIVAEMSRITSIHYQERSPKDNDRMKVLPSMYSEREFDKEIVLTNLKKRFNIDLREEMASMPDSTGE